MSQLHTTSGRSATSSGLTLAGWVAWRRRSRTSSFGPQDPIEAGHAGQVGALVEQGEVHLVGRAVDEAGRAEQVEDGLDLGALNLFRGAGRGLRSVPVAAGARR